MKAAGQHFSLAHPAVAVDSGASKSDRIAEDQAAFEEVVPDAFWHDLRQAGVGERQRAAAHRPLRA